MEYAPRIKDDLKACASHKSDCDLVGLQNKKERKKLPRNSQRKYNIYLYKGAYKDILRLVAL